MTPDQIETLSLAPLRRLLDSIQRLGPAIDRVLDQAGDPAMRLERIEAGRAEMVRALEAAESAAEDAEDEDAVSVLSEHADALRHRLGRLDRALERAEAATSLFRQRRGDLSALRHGVVPAASDYVDSAIDALVAIQNFSFTPQAAPTDSSTGGPDRPTGAPYPFSVSADALGLLRAAADQVCQELSDSWLDPEALTEPQRLGLGAVRLYTRIAYAQMNHDRRNGVRNDVADVLDSAIADPDLLPVYRGVCRRRTRMFPAFDTIYVEGRVASDPAAFSASMDGLQSEQFGEAINFFIMSRRGRDISALSAIPAEREVVFRGGSRFHVLKVKRFADEITVFLTEVD